MPAIQPRRPRISIDVKPEVWQRLRLAAAKGDVSIRDYVLEAIEGRLREDVGESFEPVTALTAAADPVLAELWNNADDGARPPLGVAKSSSSGSCSRTRRRSNAVLL